MEFGGYLHMKEMKGFHSYIMKYLAKLFSSLIRNCFYKPESMWHIKSMKN